MLGAAAILLTMGVLYPLTALRPGGAPAADARQAISSSNLLATPAGLVSQSRFPPIHPGAFNVAPGAERDSSDNLLVLALSSAAFVFVAALPLLLRRRVRHIGRSGQPRSAVMVDRRLAAAPSVGS
jgi:hypothetical protein